MSAGETAALRAEVSELRAEVAALKAARGCVLHPKVTGRTYIGDPVCTCNPPVPSMGFSAGDPPGGWFPNVSVNMASAR